VNLRGASCSVRAERVCGCVYRELKLDKPSRPCCCFACLRCLPLCRYPQYATSINVVNAEGLHREDRSAGNFLILSSA